MHVHDLGCLSHTLSKLLAVITWLPWHNVKATLVKAVCHMWRK